MKMQVERIINNNVVSAFDSKGKEVLVMGKGIGFQAKRNKEIDQELIEKIFYLDTQTEVDKFKKLLANLPLEHIQVSNEIITYADETLGRKLNPNIYITLTDHINFAIERFQQGMLFDNPLLWDVQRLYRREYLIGEYAVALIGKQIGIRLPVDEAASIALHIVNAEYSSIMSETMSITKIIPQLVEIVEKDFEITLEEQSLRYDSFITYLRTLMQRIVSREQLDGIDQEFNDMVKKLYPKEYGCSRKIADFLTEHYPDIVLAEELAMLSIHIRRLILGTRGKE
ncbi:transcriptional antiterminator, BglG family [Anaerocolumna xylanovorans DSM 12503]|uniref:Transcriptional antiterminator, BglG family n=2 Tax=Anaerocolumna TaxID=1843210 RepID=A0A1M7Y4R4_9FIRM|nr:transcriptional antiterminator, BglG family [Anaerocolumna xylanovorans DSM 12503]